MGGLLSSLEAARVQLDSDDDDFGFLTDLFKSRGLQALVNVHNKVKILSLNYIFIKSYDLLVSIVQFVSKMYIVF